MPRQGPSGAWWGPQAHMQCSFRARRYWSRSRASKGQDAPEGLARVRDGRLKQVPQMRTHTLHGALLEEGRVELEDTSDFVARVTAEQGQVELDVPLSASMGWRAPRSRVLGLHHALGVLEEAYLERRRPAQVSLRARSSTSFRTGRPWCAASAGRRLPSARQRSGTSSPSAARRTSVLTKNPTFSRFQRAAGWR